jgi:hypothetical protein
MTTSRTISFAVSLTALALATTSASSGSTSAASAAEPTAIADREPAAHVVAPQARQAPERYAYAWPLRPFRVQHPVRGLFGDPRIANQQQSRQFHFGIDIAGANGTPVYATITGRVYLHSLHATTVAVVGDDGTEFSYWHVIPAVRTGQRAVEHKTVLGHIEAPYGHVHFSERRDGRYLNPLRPGALGPYADTTRPWLHRLTVEARNGIVAEVRDETQLAVPRPWHDLPVMPALVRWRLLTPAGRVVRPWDTLVDFRLTIPSKDEFDTTWAPGVTQNHVRAPGRFRLTLAGADESAALQDGTYLVEIAASDSRGNGFRTRRTIDLGES